MIIVTSVGGDASLRGLSFGGPPSKTGASQRAAYATPFTTKIAGNRFSFRDNAVHTAELAPDGRLRMTTKDAGGMFQVELEPLWLAADPAPAWRWRRWRRRTRCARRDHRFDQTRARG